MSGIILSLIIAGHISSSDNAVDDKPPTNTPNGKLHKIIKIKSAPELGSKNIYANTTKNQTKFYGRRY